MIKRIAISLIIILSIALSPKSYGEIPDGVTTMLVSPDMAYKLVLAFKFNDQVKWKYKAILKPKSWVEFVDRVNEVNSSPIAAKELLLSLYDSYEYDYEARADLKENYGFTDKEVDWAEMMYELYCNDKYLNKVNVRKAQEEELLKSKDSGNLDYMTNYSNFRLVKPTYSFEKDSIINLVKNFPKMVDRFDSYPIKRKTKIDIWINEKMQIDTITGNNYLARFFNPSALTIHTPAYYKCEFVDSTVAVPTKVSLEFSELSHWTDQVTIQAKYDRKKGQWKFKRDYYNSHQDNYFKEDRWMIEEFLKKINDERYMNGEKYIFELEIRYTDLTIDDNYYHLPKYISGIQIK